MVTLRVGGAPERAGQDAINHAQRVQNLLNDETFGMLVTETADELVRDWSEAPTTESRESAWYKLQGLQALLRRMQASVDQGLRASVEGARTQDTNQPSR